MDAFAKMKFVVARNTEAARKEFCSQLDESNSISQKDAFSDFEKVSARDLVEDIYKPAFDLKFGNRLEQNQQPLTERTTARTLFNDNIELSTSIVDMPVKESVEEPEKENQEEPVVFESKPEPIVEEP